MAPSSVNGNMQLLNIPEGQTKRNSTNIDTINIENLLLRDDDIFQTSLNSEDYLESLAPIIKDALKVNGLSDLIYKLNDIVKDKDDELNDLSLSSTQDINSCIDSIDNIHVESYDLNQGLLQISQFLNRSVHELITRKKNLIKSKEVTSKINETNVTLNLCIQVLEITNKIHELIKQNNYFSALKLIDELTNIHLPKVENFSFAVKIYESIPHLTKMIKDESFENLGKWLAINLERKLVAIGEALFDNLFLLQQNWEKIKKSKDSSATFMPYKLNSPVELSMRDPSSNYNIFDDEALQISLSSLFDAILVYQTLNEDELLSKLYHKEWMKKYNRVIYPITSSVKSPAVQGHNPNDNVITDFNNLPSLDEYLKKISAFFVMDKQINLATKFQLRSHANSNDLWDSYAIKLKPVLINYLKTHKLDANDLTDFKDLVGNFLQIMENSGYKVFDLYEILIIIFQDYFGPDLIQQFRLDFIESIQSDHYMPLVVQDKRDYENVMKICWYKSDAPFAPQNVHSMPISFPFSEDYVHYCLGIRSLLEEIIQFISQHYSYNVNEINNFIVNDIFEKVLGNEKGVGINNDIQEFIDKNANNKEVMAQSYTNLEYYLFSLYEIGKLINRRLRLNTGTGVHNIDANGTFTLKALDLFTNVRKFSEDTIFQMVDNKIRELLDMVEYDDWLPEVANKEANYSIKDFALFLENLFKSIFSNLPLSFRTLGLFRTYDFVAEHFLNILKSVDRYNRTAIENFDLDIRYLEESMSNLYSTQDSSTENTEDGGAVALQSTFTELRQCIDLLKLDSYEDFIKNASFRMRKFDRVKLEDGLKLISKMQLPLEEDDEDANISAHEESMNTSTNSIDLQNQSVLSNSASTKFAKFSSKFRRKNDFDNY